MSGGQLCAHVRVATGPVWALRCTQGQEWTLCAKEKKAVKHNLVTYFATTLLNRVLQMGLGSELL